MKNKLLSALILTCILRTLTCFGVCPSGFIAGDINGDCRVDVADMQIMAVDWLTEDSPSELGGSNVVDLSDFSLMACNWLESLPGIIITQTGSFTTVEEFGQSDIFIIELLTPPISEVRITISCDSEDLEINGGFAGDDAVITFEPAGSSLRQTVSISAAEDMLEEGNETVTLTLAVASLDADYNGFTVGPIMVYVIDGAFKLCPRGDIDGDCRVSLEDLLIMASQWLNDDDCDGSGCADLAGLDVVNNDDLWVLSETWEEITGPVVINEFMAENNSDFPDISPLPSEVFDETGEPVDWIELRNISDKPVSLEGWYMTDDRGNMTKWEFPAAAQVAANGYLLIYASGNDHVSGNYIHTNFSLDNDGEYLALVRPDLQVASEYNEYEYEAGKFGFAPQVSNVSYGMTDYLQQQRYFSPATPNSENINSVSGTSPDTKFSIDRGFYSSPFDLVISTSDPEAIIRYTTDGSQPNWSKGQTLLPGESIHIAGTTVVRSRSYLPGYLPSNVDTHTYIFINDVITQQQDGSKPWAGWPEPGTSTNGQNMVYGMDPDIVNSGEYGDLIDDALLAIPTLCMSVDTKDLFDAAYGIYVNASDSRMESEFWTLKKERPCSLELLNPNGEEGFNIDCGVRIRGGWSRSDGNPKHAFRFFFRSKYGKSKLDHPLFEDEGVSKFDKIDLRTSQNYSWSFTNAGTNFHNTMLRDVFSRDMQGKLGQPYTRSRYYHLYIDGIYWGLFQTQERADSRFATSYMDGKKEDYDVIKPDRLINRDMMAIDGNMDAFERLWAAVVDGITTAEEYYRLQGMNIDGSGNNTYERLLDIDNLIDFMIINYYTADTDGSGSRFGNKPNNVFCIYNRADPDGFKWFEHDSEHSMGISGKGWPSYENMVTPFTTAGSNLINFNPHWLHEQMISQNEEYRLRFSDRVQELFFHGGAFTPDAVWDMLTVRKDQIDLAIIAESARWGDTNAEPARTRQSWYDAVQYLKDFIYGTHSSLGVSQPWDEIPRELRVLQQFKDADFFPNIEVPEFKIDGAYQHGGTVAENAELTAEPGSHTDDGSYIDQELTGETTAVFAYVPVDDSLGLSWTSESFVPGPGWTDGSSTTAVGYERNSGYEDWIGTNVESQMYNGGTSVFCRIEFNYDGTNAIEQLQLHIRYDDAFIAYLNGYEICRSSNILNDVPGSAGANGHEASSLFEQFDISDKLSSLKTGANVLAIHGINISNTSSDMIIQPMLIGQYWQSATSDGPIWYTTDGSDPRLVGGAVNAVSARRFTEAVTLTKSTRVKARQLNGSQWSALSNAAYSVGPVAESLRITELMYHPADPNTEFIELQNIASKPINLNLVEFTQGVDFVFGDSVLDPNQYVLIVQDLAAFEAKYGDGLNIAGQYTGRLDNGGERILVKDACGTVIHDFKYSDSWYEMTDGSGFSLNIANPASDDLNDWASEAGWRSSLTAGGTPGGKSHETLAPGSIVINELLAHSHETLPDWIELYNTTAQNIDISGWFLSDNNDDEPNTMKYQIPNNTVINSNEYIVLYENTSFGDPGLPADKGFGLSEGGETLYLYSGQGNQVTGYYNTRQKFDASESGVSFGRFDKAELSGGYDFVRMSPSPGVPNNGPMISDIVITEIYYNPVNGSDHEFVELYNRSAMEVTLMTQVNTETSDGVVVEENISWRLDGTDFQFPEDTTISAGERIIIAKDPGSYSAAPCRVFGPYSGKLDNDGEQVELQMPGDKEFGENRYWIPVEKIDYDDTLPWPTSADGAGDSLHRIDTDAYGRDYSNWQAATPQPGN